VPIVSLSADGTRLAAGSSYGGTTEVWDVASHAHLATLPGAPGSFVPGGHVIPISQTDRIDLWDTDAGTQVGQPLTGFTNAVASRVSSDGRLLAALDGAHGIRVFDLSTRQPVGPPVGLDTGEVPVGFLPGGRLAVWGQSRLTVWRPGTLAPPIGTVVGDHGGSGTGARVHGAFVAGSDDVLTAAVDAERDLQWWDPRTGAGGRPVLAGQVRSRAGVSADGALLAGPTADRDAIGVWDLAGATLQARIPTSSPAQAAVWAPTGSLLATAATEQAVRFWDLSDPNHPHPIGRITAPGAPPEGNEPELYPYFSDDGRRIALVDNPSETVTVFDVASRRQLWTRHLGSLQQVAFSPDGRTLAVLTTPTVRLLDAATGEQGRSFTVPGAGAVGLQYVRGGSALATTTLLPASALDRAADGAGALLWDVETLEPIGSPMPLGLDGTAQIARDEEGARMVTGSTSGRAVVWDLDVDHWEEAACRLTGRNLTRDEWARYLPTQPYREACPQQA
jgi:WD40 repeat protein